MGTVRRVGEDYYIEFKARGLKYQQKAGGDKQAAWRLLAEVEGNIRKGEMGILVRDVEYPVFFADFLDQVRREHSSSTGKRYEAALKHFQAYLQGRKSGLERLSQITPKVLEDYRHDLHKGMESRWTFHTPALVNLTILLLRDAFDYAIKTGFLNDNPLLHIRFAPMPAKKIVPPAADLEALPQFLTNCGENIGDLKNTALFAVFTGLRAWELCVLQWQDIDWQRPAVRICPGPLEEAHANPARIVPLESCPLDILKRQKTVTGHHRWVFGRNNGEPWTPAVLQQEWNRLLRRYEIWEVYTFHLLRHAFAYRLLARRVSLSCLYRLMGYQDILRVVPYICYYSQRLPEDTP
jgi:integrase